MLIDQMSLALRFDEHSGEIVAFSWYGPNATLTIGRQPVIW